MLRALISLLTAATQRTHILIIILRLEATSLALALIYGAINTALREDYIGIIVLTFAAAETAAALALLTSLTRLSGTDLISSCSFHNYNSVPGKTGYH